MITVLLFTLFGTKDVFDHYIQYEFIQHAEIFLRRISVVIPGPLVLFSNNI